MRQSLYWLKLLWWCFRLSILERTCFSPFSLRLCEFLNWVFNVFEKVSLFDEMDNRVLTLVVKVWNFTEFSQVLWWWSYEMVACFFVVNQFHIGIGVLGSSSPRFKDWFVLSLNLCNFPSLTVELDWLFCLVWQFQKTFLWGLVIWLGDVHCRSEGR